MARSGHSTGQHAPAFPTRQMFVLALCRICEPIALMSIFPYIYYMVESFNITSDGNRIALYAGMVTSAFAFAECLAGPVWGRLSDKFGRKPILLIGIAGTGISMVMFGFARDLPTALLARALGGLLNGNIGVLQTTVAEVITVESHQARAYAIMPSVWCMGSIIGSAMGGALADPVSSYPAIFSRGTVFEHYPYLLTNLICASVVLVSLTVGLLFMEETHEDKKDRRDIGLELGQWISRKLRGTPQPVSPSREDEHAEQMLALMAEDEQPPVYTSAAASPTLPPTSTGPAGVPPPAYRSIEGSPRPSIAVPTKEAPSTRDIENALEESTIAKTQARGVSSAFTRQVVYNIVGFGILAYHTMSAEQLLPVLFSMPGSDSPTSLPFKFTGGFALSMKTVGFILAAQALIQMVATLVVFPTVNRHLGTLTTYRMVIMSYPLLYIIVPYLTLVPAFWRMPAICAVMVWKVTAQAFALPSTNIMLANSAPTTKVLGTLNGVASSAASGCRAFGPTISGMLQSAGLSVGVLGLLWWVNACIACSGGILSLFMIEEKRRSFDFEKFADDHTHRPLPLALEDDSIAAALVAAESLNASSDGLLSAPGSPLLTRMSLDIRRNARRESRT